MPKEMPKPTGKQCVEGTDQTICDKQHPGNSQGQKPNNTPSDAWYKDMAKQMYEMQQALDGMVTWSGTHDRQTMNYSMWLRSIVQQYYSYGYEPDHTPRSYSFGRMSRGDYNYYYYYWVQPIYYELLYKLMAYRVRSPADTTYMPYLRAVSQNYHDLVRCNYGFNGNDGGAQDDSHAVSAESAIGLVAQ
jgi:hypothetical protein